MMPENLRRITVVDYLNMAAAGDKVRAYYYTYEMAWREVSSIEPIPGYQYLKLINAAGLYQCVESDDPLYIECSAEEALEDDRARIERNLAYWQQMRLSSMRQLERGLIQVVPWQTAYNRSVWWEDALRRLEAEHERE